MGTGPSVAVECCVRREDGTSNCCDVNGSFFGEDAFYRDAFYDCEEGNRSHDRLFANAREQARLKMRKGAVVANYVAFELKQKATADLELQSCISHPKKSEGEEPSPRDLRKSPKARGGMQPEGPSSWFGHTIPRWTSRGMPETGEGPFWAKGDGNGLKVRCGPNYVKTGMKTESTGSMYEAVSCDTIRSDMRLENIVESLGKLPPPPETAGESERAGGPTLQWTLDCPLPRVICINLMLPFDTGLVPFKRDAGCSFVGFFHIKPETLKAAKSENPPAAVRLLRNFCSGPAGKPGGDPTDPNRCLGQRVRRRIKKDQQAGLFKAMAFCANPQDVHVPEMFHTYNGKPCLITKCGYIVKDPLGEWLEIGIDVRGFNILARKMLVSFRTLLPQTKIHYGFLIQGVEDEDMPEGLLCDMWVYGIDMMEDPEFIQLKPSSGDASH